MDLKFKYLLVAFGSCIFITLVLPNIFQVSRFDSAKFDGPTNKSDTILFGQYSTWPSFLTDPTFDLVTRSPRRSERNESFSSDIVEKILLEQSNRFTHQRSSVIFQKEFHFSCRLSVRCSANFDEETRTFVLPFLSDVLHTLQTIYEIKSDFAQVQYPERFAEKILKMFNNDKDLFGKAQEQVEVRLGKERRGKEMFRNFFG